MTSRNWQRPLCAVASMAAVYSLALAGCPGTLDDPDRFRGGVVACDPDASICADAGTSTMPMAVSTARIKAEIFEPKCAFAGCHGNTMTQGMLDLSGTPGALESSLIEARSMTAVCNGRTLVVPGDPDRSLVFTKLSMTATLCGTRMPQGPELSAAEKALVRQWIVDLGLP